jgi:hypothetical protein
MTQPATPLLSEPGPTRVLKIICVLFCVLSASCSQYHGASNNSASRSGEREYEEANRHPEMLQHPPLSEWPLPNLEGGIPLYGNFYRMDDYFPAYLLCSYDIDVYPYDRTREAEWFKAALEGIRQSGSDKFPPIKWIAVIIYNRREHKDAATFERSFKVGAIFKASDVFDLSHDLSQMIAAVQMDRHPFKYDKHPSIADENQRWLIVEQHAATNPPTAGSN